MDCDRTSKSPRLILDESINYSSLKVLLDYGLKQRCTGAYQNWHVERTRDGRLMKQRESDAIADWRKQQEVVLTRIKTGIVRWLAAQAVAQYPCACRSCIYAKTDEFTTDP